MDLMPFVNKAGCECLNESDDHGFENGLRKDLTFLESDCDEQVSEMSILVQTSFFPARNINYMSSSINIY